MLSLMFKKENKVKTSSLRCQNQSATKRLTPKNNQEFHRQASLLVAKVYPRILVCAHTSRLRCRYFLKLVRCSFAAKNDTQQDRIPDLLHHHHKIHNFHPGVEDNSNQCIGDA